MRVFISESLRSRTRHRVKKLPPKTETIFDANEAVVPSCMDDQYHDDIGEQFGRPQPQIHAMSAEETPTTEEQDDLINIDKDVDEEVAEDNDTEFTPDLDEDAGTAEDNDTAKGETETETETEPEADDNPDTGDAENVKGDVETPDNDESDDKLKASTEPPATEKENADDTGDTGNIDAGNTANPAGAGAADNDPDEKVARPDSHGKDKPATNAGQAATPTFFKLTKEETVRQSMFKLLATVGVSNTSNLLYKVTPQGVQIRTATATGLIETVQINERFESIADFTMMLRRNGGIPF